MPSESDDTATDAAKQFAEKLPNRPMKRSAVNKLDEQFLAAISPTWQVNFKAENDEDREYTEDLIVVTDDLVFYFFQDRDGWHPRRTESYEDDDEFEAVMDDVHDFAVEFSQQRIEENAGVL